MGTLLLLAFVLSATFLPMAIALGRRHHNRAAIGVTNLVGALLMLGSCGSIWLGATSLSPTGRFEDADRSTIGLGFLLGLVVSGPFWIAALIWSATAVRLEPPLPAPVARAPRSTDDNEPPVYEIPPPPKRRR